MSCVFKWQWHLALYEKKYIYIYKVIFIDRISIKDVLDLNLKKVVHPLPFQDNKN